MEIDIVHSGAGHRGADDIHTTGQRHQRKEPAPSYGDGLRGSIYVRLDRADRGILHCPCTGMNRAEVAPPSAAVAIVNWPGLPVEYSAGTATADQRATL